MQLQRPIFLPLAIYFKLARSASSFAYMSENNFVLFFCNNVLIKLLGVLLLLLYIITSAICHESHSKIGPADLEIDLNKQIDKEN